MTSNTPSKHSDLTSPLLCIENLSVAFDNEGGKNLVVDKVSLDVFPAETVALVGESGSGKSVTAYSVLKLLPYPMASHPTGQIFFKGQSILQNSEAEMRRLRGSKIGMIFQEPMTALNPLHNVEKQISEIIMQHHGVSRSAARPRVLELLRQVQIRDPETRLNAYPHQLSGGQRQRIMIAMALANEPDLLIADEPTTALDVTVQKDILELLKQIQQQRGLAMLLITHDLSVVKHMADRVVVMRNGCVVETADTPQLFSNPQQDYTKMLINSNPKGGPVAVDPNNAKLALEVSEVNVNFALKKNLWGQPTKILPAVTNAKFTLTEGETLGVVGESGSGKSTLAMAVLSLIEFTGRVSLRGTEISQLTTRQLRPLRSQMQVVFQDPFASLSPRMTIEDIIMEGLSLHSDQSRHEHVNAVAKVMREVGLKAEDRHRYPHEFSGGQRQRIAIARALVLNPKVLILDEPTSALDKAVQAQVIDLLKKLQLERKLSYLFISHDLSVIKSISHSIVVMKQGDIVEYGPANEVLVTPKSEYTKRLLAASLL